MWFLCPPDCWTTNPKKPPFQKKNMSTQRLKPESVIDSPHTLSCNTSPWLTFPITMVTQQTSGDLSGIPPQRALCERASVRACGRGWAVPPAQEKDEKGKAERRIDQIVVSTASLWVTNTREGWAEKILFWDGCYRNIISRRGGGGQMLAGMFP